jgi:hypothetical protein
MPRKTAAPPLLTVLHDGTSELWRTRIAIYKLEARQSGIDIAWRDFAAEPAALRALGLDPAAARRALDAGDGDGALFKNAAALALVWSALPSHRRLGHLLATPAASAIARACERIACALRTRRSGPAPAAGA